MGGRATWHLCGLSGLQETSNGNVLRPMINPNQRNLYMEKSRKIREDPPHKERSSSPRKQRSVLHFYKYQNP